MVITMSNLIVQYGKKKFKYVHIKEETCEGCVFNKDKCKRPKYLFECTSINLTNNYIIKEIKNETNK